MTGRAAAAAVPVRPPRDLRLGVLRGWMQVSIFVSHVVGTALAWGIHASWGLSDSSEQFVLLSGLALGSVFAEAARDGAGAARADLLRRTLRLYGVNAANFAVCATTVLVAEWAAPLPGEAERLGFGWLVEAPWQPIPAAATLLYQPAFMGVLPVFVWCMLALAPFLWLLDRIGARALLPNLLRRRAARLAQHTGDRGQRNRLRSPRLAGPFHDRRLLLPSRGTGGDGAPRRV